MPQVPDWAAYAGYWVAVVKGEIAGVGRSEKEAYLAAKAARRREEPEVIYVAADGTPRGAGARQQPVASSAPANPSRLHERGADYWTLPPFVHNLSALLRDLGATGWLVGGSVRDVCMGREIHDLDVVAGGDALALGRNVADLLGGAYYPLDEERRVARVILNSDSESLCVDLSALRGGGIDRDLRMRDFTVNAMALPLDDPRRESVLDPTGGLADLELGVLRMVTDHAFADDPARLLRAVRFAEELSLRMDAATEAQIASDAPLLQQVSPERLRDEVNRMLALPRFGRCAREMDRLGLLTLVLPEVEGLRGLAQPPPHVWDGLEHTIRAVEAVESLAQALVAGGAAGLWAGFAEAMAPLREKVAEYLDCDLAPEQPRLSILKMAALLHDVGKPATRSEERGRIRFLEHPDAGARMAGEALTRLRYSAAAVRMAATLVREHMRLLSLLRTGEASNRALYRFHQSLGDASTAAGMLFLADLAATRPSDTEPRWVVAQAIVTRVMQACLAEPQVVAPTPLVDGRDLIEALGVSEGPLVGYLIHAVREEQAAGTVHTREEALAFAARALKRWKRVQDENR